MRATALQTPGSMKKEGERGGHAGAGLLAGPVEETHAGVEQGRSVRIHPPGEKGAAETTCDGLTTDPTLCPPALLRGGERIQERS